MAETGEAALYPKATDVRQPFVEAKRERFTLSDLVKTFLSATEHYWNQKLPLKPQENRISNFLTDMLSLAIGPVTNVDELIYRSVDGGPLEYIGGRIKRYGNDSLVRFILNPFTKRFGKPLIKEYEPLTDVSQIVFNENGTPKGYTIGGTADNPRDLGTLSAALGFRELIGKDYREFRDASVPKRKFFRMWLLYYQYMPKTHIGFEERDGHKTDYYIAHVPLLSSGEFGYWFNKYIKWRLFDPLYKPIKGLLKIADIKVPDEFLAEEMDAIYGRERPLVHLSLWGTY